MLKRKPVLYLALVALLFLAGDRLGGLVLGHAVDASDFRFARLYRGGLDYDVLVVGNSRAVHSVFAPELSADLCRSVFNIAFNGMSGEVTEAVVEDYLTHNRAPKAVLMEVSNAADRPSLVAEMRLFARHPGSVRDLVRRDDPSAEIWSTLSHLYSFDNEMTLRALYYLRRNDQDWIIEDNPMTPDVIAHIPTNEYEDYHFRPDSVAAIRRLAGDLKARGIEPVLYIAPFHPYFQKLVPHYEQWVSELQRELGPQEPIIDMSRLFQDNDNFSDLLHTNIQGSRAVMAVLADRLRQILPSETAASCPLQRNVASVGAATR